MRFIFAGVTVLGLVGFLLMPQTKRASLMAVEPGSYGTTMQNDQPVELGKVSWLRDLGQAVKQSKEQNKPIALLFQEVPGWAGCKEYGQQVLAQPLVIEMLEEYFVPVAIYNNTGGKDKQILEKFGEPAWNYQVMRFLDFDLKDIIPRKDRVWDVDGTVNRLVEALQANSDELPDYVQKVLIPERSRTNKVAAFAMYCFWTGEAKLGSLDGVIATEAGFFDGHEVVVVKYDEEKIDLLKLVAEAEKFECASAVYLPNKEDQSLVENKTRLRNVKKFSFKKGYRRAPDSDQKRQLMSQKTRLKELGLSPMQWTKLNSSVVSGDAAKDWLSPRQKTKLANIK